MTRSGGGRYDWVMENTHLIGSTDGFDWGAPTPIDLYPIDGVTPERQVEEALEPILLDPLGDGDDLALARAQVQGEIAALASVAVAEVRRSGVFRYGQPPCPHGSHVGWSFALVTLPE